MSQTQTACKPALGNAAEAADTRRPLYRISESGDGFSVQVDLPGVNRDGLDISVDEDILSIAGVSTGAVPENWRPLRRELKGGDYHLKLRLNVPIDGCKIKAHLEAGVLDLTLPKVESVKSRKIKIS